MISLLILMSASAFACGDVNADGKSDISDAVLALRAVVGLEDLDVNLHAEADVDSDSKVDVSDAIAILRHIVGLTPSPTCLDDTNTATLDEKVLAQWINDLQYPQSGSPNPPTVVHSEGAIRKNMAFGAYDPNDKAYYTVVPYISNLAVLNLLHTQWPTRLQVAHDWIKWFLNHRDVDGVPYEYFYQIDDKNNQNACPYEGRYHCYYNDASDSAAATFFMVLWAYHQAGGDVTFPNDPGLKDLINNLADTFLTLQDNTDGLFWTKTASQTKLLMNNCEDFAGSKALSQLQKIYGDSQRAAAADAAAEGLRKGIESFKKNRSDGLYNWGINQNVVSPSDPGSVWYPDMMAQFWPLLNGVIPTDSDEGKLAIATLEKFWNISDPADVNHLDWATMPQWLDTTNIPKNTDMGYLHPDAAYAALLAGDKDRVQKYLQNVKPLVFPSGSVIAPPPPFTVSDAGFLLAILRKLDL